MWEAVHAGTALPSGLRREVVGDPGGHLQGADVGAEDVEHPGPDGCAERGQGGPGEADVQSRARDPRTVVAPDEDGHGVDRLSRGDGVDESRSARDLDDAGSVDGSGDREQ
jgi:hypothetical protein